MFKFVSPVLIFNLFSVSFFLVFPCGKYFQYIVAKVFINWVVNTTLVKKSSCKKCRIDMLNIK